MVTRIQGILETKPPHLRLPPSFTYFLQRQVAFDDTSAGQNRIAGKDGGRPGDGRTAQEQRHQICGSEQLGTHGCRDEGNLISTFGVELIAHIKDG